MNIKGYIAATAVALVLGWWTFAKTQVTGTTSIISGTTTVGVAEEVLVDTDGHLQVDVLSGGGASLVFGGGTEAAAQRVTIANDSTGLLSVDDNGGSLTVDSADLSTLAGTVSGSEQQVDVVSSALPTGAATEATLVTIDADTSTLAGTVSGSEQQVDVVAALPAGSAAIGSIISVTTSVVPGVAAVHLGKAEDAVHGSGDTGVMMLGVRNDAQGVLCGTDGDYCPMATFSDGSIPVRSAFSSLFLIEQRGSTTAANPAKPEDSGHTTGHSGMFTLGVQNEALATFSATPLDYVPTALDRAGSPLTTAILGQLGASTQIAKSEDSPAGNAHPGNFILGIRNDGAATSLIGANNDYGGIALDDAGRVFVKPIDAVLIEELIELIGIDEAVDQNEYGASVAVTLAATHSGELLKACLTSTEDGTGAVLTPTGTLLVLNADPSTAAGDASITAAERLDIIAQIQFSAASWQSDANGATNCKVLADSFEANSTLVMLWFHEDATGYNSAAGDDEQLELLVQYRRDS